MKTKVVIDWQVWKGRIRVSGFTRQKSGGKDEGGPPESLADATGAELVFQLPRLPIRL